jgi:hypothetical protein
VLLLPNKNAIIIITSLSRYEMDQQMDDDDISVCDERDVTTTMAFRYYRKYRAVDSIPTVIYTTITTVILHYRTTVIR